ncbi:c8b51517-8671-4eb2-9276-9b87a9553289 [Sclerotinia trifoliorum]|uniref:C8b51517-8671-4eb2-9276-9b87a9553289 n=1 Tax=Sclerotinia trifoliorum TaxID=28548 RepID=A0A8H2W2E4_9HELO|nr:c8b51517-8671-4eb2-9276-9b87a9553289 [Sclerotinia trifoliorum]
MATTAGSRNQTNGVLSVTTTQTSGSTSKQTVSKPASSKLKLIVRRLAPGLTEAEFCSVLGDEWKVGQGKVDWFQFKSGKDSKDPSKPSRPSRAYLHLTSGDHLLPFSEVVRKSSFEDAKNSYTDSCLIGPPSVEFAPYSRVPAGLKRRTDARAGTIDQDPEFMAFLEGLANPITTKEIGAEGEDFSTGKPEKITVTPLVQFLKDKKANKTKESAAKAAKKQEIPKSKAKEGSVPTDDGRKSNKDPKTDKVAATQEAVRILNREAAKKTAAASSSTATSTSTEKNVPKLDTSKIPANERQAVVAAHVRMLHRDLGLSPSQAHRRIKRDTASAVKAEASDKSTPTPSNTASSPSTPTTPTGPKVPPAQLSAQSGSRRSRRGNQKNTTESSATKGPTATASAPTTPMVLLRKFTTQQRPEQRPSTATSQSSSMPQAPPKAAPKVNPPAAPAAAQPQQATPNRGSKAQVDVPPKGARQAFIKHANPSQGVTELLLKEALEKFGKVSMVEIDKKKGFAYADFEEPEGLKKAMAANPVSVAQGTVHVMQRKGNQLPRAVLAPRTPAPPPTSPASRGGRGGAIGRRGGRNGGGRGRTDAPAADSPKPSPVAVAPTGPAPK